MVKPPYLRHISKVKTHFNQTRFYIDKTVSSIKLLNWVCFILHFSTELVTLKMSEIVTNGQHNNLDDDFK